MPGIVDSPRVVSGSVQLLLGNAYFAVASYTTLVVIARKVGISAFGQYVVVVSILLWLELVAAEAFKHPLLSEFARGRSAHVKRLLFTQGAVVLLISLLLIASAPLLAGILGDKTLAWLLCIAAIDILPYSLYVSFMTLLNAMDRYSAYLSGSLMYATGKVAFMGSAAFFFESVELAILGMAFASALAALVAGFLCIKSGVRNYAPAVQEFPAPKLRQREVSKPYGVALLITAGSGVLLVGDVWVVQASGFGATVVGEYGAVHNLVKLMQIGAGALMWALAPTLARYASFVHAFRAESQFRIVSYLILIGLCGSSVIFVCGAEQLISLFFGSQYRAGATILRVMAPAYAALVLAYVVLQLMYYIGLARHAAAYAICAAIVYPPTAWLLGNVYGPRGVVSTIGIVATLLLLSLLIHSWFATRRPYHTA